ncbi:MAG: hypothetical protein R3C32_01300 [Chloroflexota bacterium]
MPGWRERPRRETSVADPALWARSLACLARRGRVAVIGAHAGPVVEVDLNWLFRQRVSSSAAPGRASPRSRSRWTCSPRVASTRPSAVWSRSRRPRTPYRRLMGRDRHHAKTIIDMSLSS